MKNLTKDVKIRISRKTRSVLLDMGRKGETYDDVIRRLMYIREYIKRQSDDAIENAEMRFYEEAEG